VDRGDRALPVTLRVAIGLMWGQALALALLLAFLVVAIGQQDARRLVSPVLWPFEILAALVVVTLVTLGWQLRRLRGWARGPVLALELLFAPIAYYLVGLSVVGILIIVSAIACVALLIAPASRTALGIRP
jgi:hypothetical protein